MMMFLLPILAVTALVASIATNRWFAKAALLAMAIAYAAGLGLISYDPYFEDNGSREFIEWRFRWVWAAEIGGWLTLLTLPIVLAIGAAYRRVRYGGKRDGE